MLFASRRTPRLLSVALVLVALAGCTGGGRQTARQSAPPGDVLAAAAPLPPSLSGSFGGKVAGTDAFVAIVSDGSAVSAYVCDSADLVAWLAGGVASNRIDIADESGYRLRATLAETGAVGSVVLPDGTVREFRTEPPTEETLLYRADLPRRVGAPYVGGWVLLGDEQRGSVTWGSKRVPAPELDPRRGLEVRATLNRRTGRTIQLRAVPVRGEQEPAPTPNRDRPFVVVTFGDSFSSGEGNPAVNGNHNKDGKLEGAGTYAEKWTTSTDARVRDEAIWCHRSDKSASHMAVERLKQRFSRVDVVFRHFGCSGATLRHVVSDGSHTGIEPGYQGRRLAPQMQQARDWLATMDAPHVDAVIVFGGVNDVHFGSVVDKCIREDCATDEHAGLISGYLNALPARHQALHQALTNLRVRAGGRDVAVPVERVYLSQYPDPTRDENGVFCDREDSRLDGDLLGDGYSALGFGITRTESRWAYDNILVPLNAKVRDAAERYEDDGWRYVTGLTAAFRRHGFCSTSNWINRNNDALRKQGWDARDTPIPVSAGIMHPNRAGHEAVADILFPLLEEQATDRFRPRTPTLFRQHGAQPNGPIELRWRDVSDNETSHELQFTRIRNDGSESRTYIQQSIPPNTQRYTFSASARSTYRLRLRACGRTGCSDWTPPVVASNFVPPAPSNLEVRQTSPGTLGIQKIEATWADASNNELAFDVTVRRLPDGEARLFVAEGSTFVYPPDPRQGVRAGERYRVEVKACSVAGCSEAIGAEIEIVPDNRPRSSP